MAKRADDRYESAAALATDLRHWLAQVDTAGAAAARDGSPGRSLVSRGLRPYDDADSDTFLDLVPGPRGRDGLPECIGFWKRRIEAGGDAEPFPVGVIYGPTGSGKSSLVRAGLIPRLAESVCCVYVESTMEGTEQRLLRGLRSRFPALAAHQDAAGLLRELRQGRNASGPAKVLIVLDQFEQWLFGQRSGGRGALEDALRQCDGERHFSPASGPRRLLDGPHAVLPGPRGPPAGWLERGCRRPLRPRTLAEGSDLAGASAWTAAGGSRWAFA